MYEVTAGNPNLFALQISPLDWMKCSKIKYKLKVYNITSLESGINEGVRLLIFELVLLSFKRFREFFGNVLHVCI